MYVKPESAWALLWIIRSRSLAKVSRSSASFLGLRFFRPESLSFVISAATSLETFPPSPSATAKRRALSSMVLTRYRSSFEDFTRPIWVWATMSIFFIPKDIWSSSYFNSLMASPMFGYLSLESIRHAFTINCLKFSGSSGTIVDGSGISWTQRIRVNADWFSSG